MSSKAFALGFVLLPAFLAAQSPVHNYDLQHVEWHIGFDEAKGAISGRAINTLKLEEAGAAQVWLHCVKLNVSKVTVDGREASFKLENGKLVVTLPRYVSQGQSIKVEADYTGTPECGIYFVSKQSAYPSKTGMIYTQGQGEDTRYWLPTYDYPDDKATTEGYIEVPKAYSTIGNGILVGSVEEGDKRIDHWMMNQPHSTYLISFIVGEYTQVEKFWKNLSVSYFVPPGLESYGETSFGRTPEMIELYSRLTGIVYPYDKFAQSIVGDFVFGGMENVTAVTNTSRTLHPAANEPVESSEYLVLHELAHQWFGDLITCRTWDHTWVNEGWATFLPNFWDREQHGQRQFDYNRYSTFQQALDAFKNEKLARATTIGTDPIPTTLGNPYPGGSARMFMLMDQLGEPRFWRAVRDYLKQYSFQPVTTEDFFSAVGKSAGVNLTSFMNQFFKTHATPELTAYYSGRDLVISQPKPYYTLDVPVWIWGGSGWIKRWMHLDGPEARLDASVNFGKPVLVDPEVHLMADIATKIPLTTSEIIQIYQHAPNVASKARIIDAWFNQLSQDQIVQLMKAEHFWALVNQMVPKLDASSIDIVISLIGRQDRRVANTAIQALAKLSKSDAAISALQDILAKDPNSILRESALDSLLALTSDASLAERAWNMDALNDGFRIRAMQWWAKNDPDTAREKALSNLAAPGSEPLRYACIEALGVVKDKPGERRAFDALAKILSERSYRARLTAIQALGAYGSKDAIPVLEPFLDYGQNALRGTATAVVSELRKK